MSENTDLAAIEAGGPKAPLDLLGGFANIIAAIGTTWTFALMFLIVADVIGRSFFSLPITGVAEIAAHSIVAIVFLQLASAVHARRMTRADFLIDMILKSSPSLGRAIEAFFLAVGCVVMLLIAYATWKPMMVAYTGNEFFGVQGIFTIKTWPLRATILGGSVLTAVVFAVQAIQEAALIGKSPRAGAR
ncbi:MAG: TRAP transporter small permease [Bosea sp. (in: a-proteobacteria)]